MAANLESNQVDKIVFATSSKRKMMMLEWFLSGTDIDQFLVEKGYAISEELVTRSILPIALQRNFSENVYNGDSQLKEQKEIFVGMYEAPNAVKIPVFVRPSDGETKGNIPIEQAENKAHALVPHYAGHENVLVIAMDTVDSPDGVSEPLGKPMNLEEYQGVLDSMSQFPSEQAYFQNVFARWYLDTHYPVGVRLTHSNGISTVRTFAESNQVTSITRQAELQTTISEEVRQKLTVYLDSGGGGIFQQTVDWLSDSLEKYFIEDKPDFWLQLPAEQKRWVLYCQIIGMPIWVMLDEIDKALVEPIKEEVYV